MAGAALQGRGGAALKGCGSPDWLVRREVRGALLALAQALIRCVPAAVGHIMRRP